MSNPCTKCALPVNWVRVQGKWQCFNPDGGVHWDLCSQERTRVVQRDGMPFKDEKGDGFIHGGKKKYMHMVAYTDRGKPVKSLEGKP